MEEFDVPLILNALMIFCSGELLILILLMKLRILAEQSPMTRCVLSSPPVLIFTIEIQQQKPVVGAAAQSTSR
jgi:hypothetical protein